MAQNIAKFIVDNDLDGVDIDWEYPAAPDLPDIPAGQLSEGIDYLKFLITLKGLLPADKTVSFAAPASFWYLKGFPIAQIMKVVDYVVYMTYDLHGQVSKCFTFVLRSINLISEQWDYGNKWSTPGCPAGNCLRSHVNMTETLNALSMITKAGAPSNKIVVGVTSYGRSFKMTDAGCTEPMCTYVGPKSQAAKGRCTDTAGYISQNEIDHIIKNNPSTQKRHDDASLSDILVYNHTEWISYMSRGNKNKRRDLYKALNFLGTSDWAISLDGANLVSPELSSMNPVGPSLARPGVMDLLIHDTCKLPSRLEKIQEAWFEAGELSKAPYEWSRFNKYQGVMDNYFGKRSRQIPIFGPDSLWSKRLLFITIVSFVTKLTLCFGKQIILNDTQTFTTVVQQKACEFTISMLTSIAMKMPCPEKFTMGRKKFHVIMRRRDIKLHPYSGTLAHGSFQSIIFFCVLAF